MKMRLLFASILLAVRASAQTPAPTPAPQANTWSITANAVSLPGVNGQTLAGTLVGTSVKVTPNFNLESVNFITSGAQTNGYMGGVNYTIPQLSKALNNVSPTIAGYNFRFSVHGDVGVSRISVPGSTVSSLIVARERTLWLRRVASAATTSASVSQGTAALFGGQIDYAIKGSTMWSLGVRVDDFLVTTGLPHRNNLVVAFGPTIHLFGN